MTMGRWTDICKNAALLTALLAGAFPMSGLAAEAQPPVVTTRTTLDSSLQGVTGGIAVNKFGDVFQASTWEGKVYEFPAKGGAPVVLFAYGTSANYSGKGLGGVAVDANQNLYVTTIYVGAQTSSDSAIYELPYINGSYPATFTLNAPVAQCTASPTTVCSWGNFLQATGYYYQGWDFAMDGNGVGYLATLFDNIGTNNIYACNAACGTHAQPATILAANLPRPVLSLAADAAGDVFYADGSSSVYEIPVGSSTPVAIGAGMTATIGVAVDRAGNVFATDKNALYEIPRQNESYNAGSQFEVVPLGGGSVRGYNGGGVAIDVHGNIYAANGYTNLFKFNIDNGNFTPSAANSGNSTLNFNVVFNQTVTGATLQTSGPQAVEFSLSASTCATGGVAGTTCSFQGTFQPAGVGLRQAAATLLNSGGNSVVIFLSGVGQGAALTVDPGAHTQAGSAFNSVGNVAVDSAGNLFVSDTAANAVYEYAAGATTHTTVGAGFVAPTGVALDSSGNLYVADAGGSGTSKGRIVEVPFVAGTYSAAAQNTVAMGLGALKGIFVDASGTLYAADSTNKNIFALSRSQFGQIGGTTFGSGLTAPSDVVVDAFGTLYIADPPANQVVTISQEGVQSLVGSGLSGPTGIAIDASGSVIIADGGNKRLLRVPNENGSLNANDEVTIDTAIAGPYAVRADANGNLVVSDSSAQALDTVNRTAGRADFSNVNVNTTSSAQTVYLSNEGNTNLALNTPVYPAPGGVFALAQGTPACAPGSMLTSGFVCELSASFSPTVRGTQSVSIPFSTSPATAASLTLSGTGLFLAPATVSLQQTAPAGQPAYGQTITFTAAIGGANGTPTGLAALVVDGSQQPSVPLVNGNAIFTVSGLGGGPHTLGAEYFGDTNYAAAHTLPNLSITVTAAASRTTLAITADATAPLSAAVGSTVSFSSTLTPSLPGFFSGIVNYTSGTTVLASGVVTPGPNGTYTATANSSKLAPGTYQVTAVYLGTANYAASSSSSITLQVVAVASKIAVASAVGTITATPGTSGSTALTVTSLAGFQGAVTFSCSGLPSNAACQFNPAIVTLIASNASTPLVVPPLSTTLTISVNQQPLVTPGWLIPWGAPLLLLLLHRGRTARRSWRMALGGLGAFFLLATMGSLAGCGSGTPATPSGSSLVTVTAVATPSIPSTVATSSAANATSSFTINLTVK